MDQNQRVTENENNTLKFKDTIGLQDRMIFKKKKKDGTVEDIEEWTDTPPTNNIEYFTE